MSARCYKRHQSLLIGAQILLMVAVTVCGSAQVPNGAGTVAAPATQGPPPPAVPPQANQVPPSTGSAATGKSSSSSTGSAATRQIKFLLHRQCRHSNNPPPPAVPPQANQVPPPPTVPKQVANLIATLVLWPAWAGPFAGNKPITFHWALTNTTPISLAGKFAVKMDGSAASIAGLPLVQSLSPSAVPEGISPFPVSKKAATLSCCSSFWRTM